MIIVYAYGEKYKDPVLAITSPSLHNALKWRILAICLVSVDWTEKVQNQHARDLMHENMPTASRANLTILDTSKQLPYSHKSFMSSQTSSVVNTRGLEITVTATHIITWKKFYSLKSTVW